MKAIQVLCMLAVSVNLAACATAQSPVNGLLYTNTRGSDGATEAYGGSAQGQACATSILGLIATGDASIDAAKKNGQVMQVVSVDHTANSILGIYAKYCTIVLGKRGSAKDAPKASQSGSSSDMKIVKVQK